jgi:hypothetical protein
MRERIQGERDRRAATRHCTAAAPEIPTKPDPSEPQNARPRTTSWERPLSPAPGRCYVRIFVTSREANAVVAKEGPSALAARVVGP